MVRLDAQVVPTMQRDVADMITTSLREPDKKKEGQNCGHMPIMGC